LQKRSNEKDSDKIADLIRELNQELALRGARKHPKPAKPDKHTDRASRA